MFELLIIRHGETAWNTSDIVRGRVSIGLSETGLKQVTLLSEYLRPEKIQAVYCSPLQRALQTAEVIARPYGLSTQPLPDLTDLDFGEWEGMAIQDVRTKYQKIYEQWLEKPDQALIPGGEPLGDARNRALKALKEIMQRYTDGTVAVITHRVITKVLACALLGLDDSHFWNIEQSTCGITTFIHNGRYFILTHHNDVSFLKNFID